MTYSNLIQRYPRLAQAVGFILSPAQFGSTAALVAVLVLSAGVFIAGAPAYAQEPAAAPVAAVNINSANAETLATVLVGVGQSRAEEIVRYREAFGPFGSVEELIEVKGIGQSTLDKNRTVITLE